MTGELNDPGLSETDVVELDILALLQSQEAVAAFDTYRPILTPQTAGRFAELLRMINDLADGGDFAGAVEAEMFAAVRSPVDITRLERFGALNSDDPTFKLVVVQTLRTIHDAEAAPPAAGAESPEDVR